jgi:hypothetical protein
MWGDHHPHDQNREVEKQTKAAGSGGRALAYK